MKKYIETKYGVNYVCSLGTYTRMKLKLCLKDFCRVEGLSFDYVNRVTGDIDDQLEFSWRDLFKYGVDNEVIRKFIQKYPGVVNDIRHVINNPKAESVHPSAVLVVPKKGYDGGEYSIYDWLPVKKIDGIVVSEWEGKYIDRAGYLKLDILGIRQLDKFVSILALIKQNHKIDLDLQSIKMDDPKVYKLFQKGLNEDVFQFGSPGLKNYTKEAIPSDIEDLITINAIYRPSAMNVGSHKEYALIKQGRKKPKFDYGLQEVTKNTNGILIFQEQMMAATVVLGGFSAIESDTVRNYIKKFNVKEMSKYEEKFVKGAMINGCPEDQAKAIWQKILASSSYSFNRAHSAAYGVTAYWCMFLKANYTLEFYTTSLNYGKEDKDIPHIIREIKYVDHKIRIAPPDVNYSDIHFTCDPEENKIFWSITKVKGIAETTAKYLLDERSNNGKFFSFSEFVNRVPSKVNKKVIKTLILCGAFDVLCEIKTIQDRKNILLEFYNLKKYKSTEIAACEILNSGLTEKKYFWILQQKELTGQGYLDYEEIMKDSGVSKRTMKYFLDSHDFIHTKFSMEKYAANPVTVAGFIVGAKERNSKNGVFCVLSLDSNVEIISVLIWHDKYVELKETIESLMGKMVAITGRAGYDDWGKKNSVYSNDETQIIEL